MLELFNQIDYLSWLLIGLLSLLIGSFLNVVILRYPTILINLWQKECQQLPKLIPTETYNLCVPRSHCPKCKKTLAWWHNIPLMSYLFLKGHCHYCRATIPIRYPLIEVLTVILSLIVLNNSTWGIELLALLIFTWFLISLSMIDFDHHLLPDDLTLSLLWLGLCINTQNIITDLNSAVWGAIIGYSVLWLVYWVFRLITGKEGMGYGDFKLLAALGAWLGWQALPMIILISSILGSIIGITLIIFGKRSVSAHIPFGPYLAISGWVSALWSESLMSTYPFL